MVAPTVPCTAPSAYLCRSGPPQMCARSHLSTGLIERLLKPALVEALENVCSLSSMAVLMATEDSLAAERNDVMRRRLSLLEVDALLREGAARLGLELKLNQRGMATGPTDGWFSTSKKRKHDAESLTNKEQ